MTEQQARDLFGAAYDGELHGEKRAEFDALLEKNATLRDEFEAFRRVLGHAGRAFVDAASPDLMPGIRRKLRVARRDHGDKHDQLLGRGRIHPVLLGFVALVIIGVLWLAMSLLAL